VDRATREHAAVETVDRRPWRRVRRQRLAGLRANRGSMKIDVCTDIVINRPTETVAHYASNPDHIPQWYANVKSVAWHTEPPLRIGSRIAFVAYFLGRRLAYTYKIRENFKPPGVDDVTRAIWFDAPDPPDAQDTRESRTCC
jgi:hypothetical protein